MGEKYNIKKLNIDLNNSETTTFNPFDKDNVSKMMKNKEIKAVIHNFYKSKQVELDLENVEAEYRHFMWKLEIFLASKDENEGLDDMETILFFMLLKDGTKQYEHAYTEHLVNEFINVLKEVE